MNAGDRLGKLVVVSISGRRILTKCDCGTEKEFTFARMKDAKPKSCGCANRAKGKSVPGIATKRMHPLYHVWMGMMNRCYKEWDARYKWYGARGITVTERWHDFGNFVADMDTRPSMKMSLDRIDNDGNYEPSNCKWSTRHEQMGNTRTVHRVAGVCLKHKCLELGISYRAAISRMRRGITAEDAVNALIAKYGASSPSNSPGSEGERNG